MLDMIKRLFGSMKATCPVCGSNRTSTYTVERSPILVDGPSGVMCKCKKCGHKWPLIWRTGP